MVITKWILLATSPFSTNQHAELLGYSKEEMMGMNYRQYTDKEHQRNFSKRLIKSKTGEPAKGFDWQIIKKMGLERSIETSISLIKDSSGKPVGFRGIIRDITERKKADRALRESENKYRKFDRIHHHYFSTIDSAKAQ